MKQRTIVAVGGALSGPAAVARAREMDEHARIILLERNTRVSYAACGLAYHLSGEVPSIENLDREQAAFFKSNYGVEVRTQTEVLKINVKQRTLDICKKNGAAETLSYDALIFAAGAASKLPANLPEGAENVVCFRTLDDLAVIKKTITGGGRRAVVLGGGPMGVEAADGLIRGGADVTIIEKQTRLLPVFGPRIAAVAAQELARKARVLTGCSVKEFETAGKRVVALKLSNGERVEADIVISAIGLTPRTELLKKAGAKLAKDGTVVIDAQGRTSLPNVYSCGVCVSVPQVATGDAAWWPQGALADKTAQVAGANAAGGKARLVPALGSMLIRVLDITAGRAGLTGQQAAAALGRADLGVTTVHAPSHERYFPVSSGVWVQIFWSRRTGKLIGMEAAGAAGVDKRVDVAATAIAAGMTVEKLAALDLGYAPPYNATRDPLNVAATVAAQVRAKLGRSIEPEELATIKGAQIVDVRAPGSNTFKPLPNSKSIPLETLRAQLDGLDRKKPVVAVSESGRRGWLATRLLAQNGFSKVYNLSGGLRAWALMK